MAADPTSKVPIGTILVGKYRITREIGRGGMAAVYEAENVDIGKRVAVKLLSSELITSRVVRERFLREARAAAAVRSPYICDVYDVGEFDSRPFLVMELLEGESLYDLMSHVRRLDLERTVRIIVQTSKGLAKAHAAHVVHRDLKPENLFLTHNEDGELVTKLLDFGLAKFYVPSNDSANQVRLTREGALFGTPAYMSPEQAKGKGEVDHRSDLWALGCIVYECLTGQTVWNIDQGVAMILAQVASAPLPVPSRMRPDLPPAFDPWFSKALSRDPADRFQTAREFAVSLTEVLLPSDRAATQTPSLLVDVDDLTSRLSNDLDQAPATIPTESLRAISQDARPSSAGRELATSHSATSHQPESRIPPSRLRSGGGFWAVLVVAAAVGGAYYGYRNWRRAGNLSQSSARAGSSAMQSGAGTARALDAISYAESIARAEDAIIEGDFEKALAELEVAIKSGGEGIAKNFRTHLRMALDNPNSPCHLAGLARPRPLLPSATEENTKFGSDVSRPALLRTQSGTLVGWAQRQVFTTLLDDHLRSNEKPIMVAPEAANARYPQLVRVGSHIALLFWNGVGSEPGVFIRALDEQGHVASPSRRVGPIGRGTYSPSIAAAPDGTSWVVWEDDSVAGATNLAARHLDRDLVPIGSVIQLTSLKPDRIAKPGAIKPSIAIAGGRLNVTFVLRRQSTKHIQWLSIDLTSPELQTGLPLVRTKSIEKDRFIGKLKLIDATTTAGTEVHSDAGTARTSPKTSAKSALNADDVRLSCHDNYCIAAWNDNMGLQLAYLDPRSTEVVWQKPLGSHGVRSAISATVGQAAVVWYEPTQTPEIARVQLALVTRNGFNQPSVIAKVSGRDVQPYPDVTEGKSPDQWYVAWRDYEAGRLEAMLARVECRGGGSQ